MSIKNKKFKASIIIIGNEVLSGRTQDVNVANQSIWLNKNGIKVEEVRIIADKERDIIECVNQLKKKYTYVFTTGGIGPTHDDITARSVAKAFKKKYMYHPIAYKLLETYYGKNNFNEGRKKMAKMPKNSELILNPTSGAPGFKVKNVFCLPGVPSILKSMLGGIKIQGGLKTFSDTITLKTVESEIAKDLERIQKNFKNIEIGSYPFFRLGRVGVAIVLRSTNKREINSCKNKIIKFIKKKEIKII